jgi:hypothetical protein
MKDPGCAHTNNRPAATCPVCFYDALAPYAQPADGPGVVVEMRTGCESCATTLEPGSFAYTLSWCDPMFCRDCAPLRITRFVIADEITPWGPCDA